jgi:hypothetical protein
MREKENNNKRKAVKGKINERTGLVTTKKGPRGQNDEKIRFKERQCVAGCVDEEVCVRSLLLRNKTKKGAAADEFAGDQKGSTGCPPSVVRTA